MYALTDSSDAWGRVAWKTKTKWQVVSSRFSWRGKNARIYCAKVFWWNNRRVKKKRSKRSQRRKAAAAALVIFTTSLLTSPSILSLSFRFFFYTFPLLHLRTARSVPLLRRITYSCHRPFPPISFVCRIVTATPATTFRLREASLQSVIDDETHIATIFFGLSFLPAGFLVKRHTTSAMQCICYATVHSSRERTSSTTTTKTRTVLDCCSWEDSHVLRAFRVPPLFF